MAPAAKTTEAAANETVERVMKWANDYKRELLAALAVVLLAALLFGYTRHAERRAQENAWRELFLTIYKAQTGPQADLVKELDNAKVMDASARAVFYGYMKQMLALSDRDDTASLQKMTAVAGAFLDRYPQHYFAPQVRADRGKARMRLGEFEKARADLEAAVKSERSYLEGEVRLALAQCYEAQDDLQRAEDAYLEIEREGDTRGFSYLVRQTAAFALVPLKERRAREEGNLPEVPAELLETPAEDEAKSDTGEDEGNAPPPEGEEPAAEETTPAQTPE